MSKNWARKAGMVAAVACMAVPGVAIAGGEQPPPPPKDDCADGVGGRMTGGGNSTRGTFRGQQVKVTHGFTLRCRTEDHPQRLEVNWSGGNKFHLVNLTFSRCTDTALDEENPKAGFDTYEGRGFGRDGAYAEWTFTDAGEPGRNDGFKISIWSDGVRDSTPDLVVNDTLRTGGNHQAHRVTGRAAR